MFLLMPNMEWNGYCTSTAGRKMYETNVMKTQYHALFT